ncbi:CHASE3 domain-containing protein [Hydrogenophaga sp. 5NK40-0174]|uniref:CHASE3 domain-containing protein n=1 Tax=Hydrogenophaga sp. 5NK40-0174 TaxID=3127649 RepID=UPI00310B018C
MTRLKFLFSNASRIRAVAYPLAVVAALLLVGVSELAYQQARGHLAEQVDKGRARLELIRLLRVVSDAESGKRGYLLVGGQDYLDPYHQAHARALEQLKLLNDAYTALGDEEALARMATIGQVVEAKFAEMEEVMARSDAGNREFALDLVRSGIGREMMEELQAEVDALMADQTGKIGVGVGQVFETLSLSRIGVASLTFLSLLVLIMFMRQAGAMQDQRAAQQLALARERDALEEAVHARTQDLRELAQHMQTVREDERAALARELHDELGALLTAAKLDVARIKPKMKHALPDMLPRLTHLTETLNSGIALKRRIIEDLRPSTLSSLGLVPALEILCGEFGNGAGISMNVELDDIKAEASIELTLFRVVQEALTNVGKYARASRVDVTLRKEEGKAVLCVQDNGVGFNPKAEHAGHHGLRGMRFRVEAVNGMLTVMSRAGEGARICAEVPLPAATVSAVAG